MLIVCCYFVALAHLDIRPANIFIALSPSSSSSSSSTLTTMGKKENSLKSGPSSGFQTPRFPMSTRQLSITRNNSFKRQLSFPSTNPASFPPPSRLEKKISDCESVSCGMTQRSDMTDDIIAQSSQSLFYGDMSLQNFVAEELPPLEMSQPESVFEENRNKSYDNIKPEEVDKNIQNGNWNIKLGDLGFCCRLDDYSYIEGEDRYVAGECFCCFCC